MILFLHKKIYEKKKQQQLNKNLNVYAKDITIHQQNTRSLAHRKYKL